MTRYRSHRNQARLEHLVDAVLGITLGCLVAIPAFLLTIVFLLSR
jgi:hypothetical protein